MTSEEWAAWTQAAGSIAALLIAIGVSYWEGKRSARERLTREKDYKKCVTQMCFLVTREIEAMDSIIRGDFTYLSQEGVNSHDLKRHLAALDTVTLETLPNVELFTALHSIRDLGSNMIFLASNCNNLSPEGVDPETKASSERTMKEAKKYLAKIHNKLKG